RFTQVLMPDFWCKFFLYFFFEILSKLTVIYEFVSLVQFFGQLSQDLSTGEFLEHDRIHTIVIHGKWAWRRLHSEICISQTIYGFGTECHHWRNIPVSNEIHHGNHGRF